ncbi:MAG: arsenate reductase ArsC [Ktedonobacteraceae bacterium]
MKQRVLFLCTGNSARSQMAEGLLRTLAGERMDVASAGTNPCYVHPMAIRAMRERGIDISYYRSKHLDEFLPYPVDYVITVCDNVARHCPTFPGPAIRVHWDIPDPATSVITESLRMAAFRKVLYALENHIHAWLDTLP